MLADIAHRGAARLWYAKTLADGGGIPYARDEPRSRFGEGPADHVLLIGNGPAHGWGVASHQLALCGQLTRSLAEATGRAVEVEYVGAELMNAESAVPWLGDHDLAPYDGVVVVIGMNDAVRLTPVAAWERDLTGLLDHLRGGLRHDAPIVVSGIQPVESVPPFTGRFAAAGQRRADEMNLATRRITDATPGSAFVALGAPEVEPDRPYGSVGAYRGWADALTSVAAPLLDEHRARGSGHRRSRIAGQRRWRWPAAPALLDAAAERGTPELRRLVNAAKVEFGVTLAVVTLLDGDRMWFAAASADTPVSIPLELSYDRHVSDGPLVVPDADEDPRFRDNPFIAQSHLPFYAGHPIHDLGGRTIGTFCLLAARPRPAGTVALETLRTYALQAEQEFHRLESQTAGVLIR